MATLAVSSNPHNPLAPSWDEAIVPTLRKRLENESRMLTKRLSTISASTDDATQQQQPQRQSQPRPSEETHDTRSTSSSSRRTPNGIRSHTPTQRPSAIPRPSYSRTNNENLNALAIRSSTSVPAEPPISNGNRAAPVTTSRKRTHSTPFPFEPPPDPATASAPDEKQSSSSTNPGFGTAKSNGGRTTPIPSRIPTAPSRIRSGSQSSQGLNTLGKSVGAKVAPSEPNSTHIPEPSSASAPVQSSANTSTSRHRASEDHQGYRPNKPSHAGIEESINERISSDEEKPFQHWYRGDVSRNGGVGEYRVGKREEMLDIASFGHKPPTKLRRPGTQDSRVPPSTSNDRTSRKRAESVSSVERTSLSMEAPDEALMERILDEALLDDASNSLSRRPRRQSIASMERISLYMSSDLVEVSGGVSSSGIESNTMNSDSQSVIPFSESRRNVPGASVTQTKLVQPWSRNVSNTQHESKASTSTTSSLPETLASRNGRHRGRTQSPVERSSTPQKKTRSKSVADAAPPPKPLNEADFSGLADAIPDTRTPIPIDGNWDEMVLPTVARRMGIEYEKKEPVSSKLPEQQVVPAPGTFGFDYSKYRPWRPSEEAISTSEFGEAQEVSEKPPQPPSEVPIERPPEAIPQMRPRRDTLPPFAQYAGAPISKQRQDMPQVVIPQQEMKIAPPTTMYVEEGEDKHCCKCIIM